MGSVQALTNEMLLAKGLPEAFLMALGIHILTETKIDWRKYIVMSIVLFFMASTLRTLPISSGINTVLSLFGVIIIFKLLYYSGLNQIIRTIIAPIIILIIISIAEMMNLLLLSMLYGFDTANTMVKTPSGWTQCLYSLPSTVFFALLLFATYWIIKVMRKRKNKDGDVGKEISE